jgi:hypothetical protein
MPAALIEVLQQLGEAVQLLRGIDHLGIATVGRAAGASLLGGLIYYPRQQRGHDAMHDSHKAARKTINLRKLH